MSASEPQPVTPKNSLRRALDQRLYLIWDRVYKAIRLISDQIHTTLVRVFGTTFTPLSLALSKTLEWSLAPPPTGLGYAPRLFVKAVVGLTATTAISAVLMIIVLIGGSLFSLMGLRNIGEYTLKEQIAAHFVLFLILIAAPFGMSDYWTFKISLLFAYSVGVIGLDFLYGQCGILSLGHAGFLLVGGYVTTWLYNGRFGYEFPIFAAIAISAGVAGLLGILIGAPSLRVKDSYLVIITLTFALAVPKVMKSQHLANYSGVREGGLFLRDVQVPEFLMNLSPAVLNYFIVVIPSLILFLIAYNLNHNSQIGRAFKTIRCDHEVSMIMGIPVVRYKLAAFVLSGIYGAISGSFLTFLSKFIFPESFTISNSIDFVVATVVGGTGSLLGSVIGGVLMSFETDFFDFMANQLPKGRDLARVMVGILPIVAILLSQKGVAGELNRLFKAVFMNIKIRRGANRIAPPPDYDYFEAAKNSYLKRK